MKTISSVLFLALFVTIIHGFPQQKQDTASSQIEDRTKDTLSQSKPLDRSQISTFPATVDIKKQDTIPQSKDGTIKTISTSAKVDSDSRQGSTPQNIGDSRKTRDTGTVDSNNKQVPIPRGTKPPVTLDSNKQSLQNSGPQKLSEQSNSRKTRGVESSKPKNSGDVEANRHQQPQTHQSRQPPHSRDLPGANAHHPYAGVDSYSPKKH